MYPHLFCRLVLHLQCNYNRTCDSSFQCLSFSQPITRTFQAELASLTSLWYPRDWVAQWKIFERWSIEHISFTASLWCRETPRCYLLFLSVSLAVAACGVQWIFADGYPNSSQICLFPIKLWYVSIKWCDMWIKYDMCPRFLLINVLSMVLGGRWR